uniref:RING-type E3 ubiquitin transferase n=1 Tax=Romanomermis culicivorax TaxID=13658 RepID=A0A915JG30_ROMCU
MHVNNFTEKDGIQLYSQAVTNAVTDNGIEADPKVESTSTKEILCPYNLMGHCWYGEACSFAHGQLCDLCNQPVLHPIDNEHNTKHRNECLAEHEREMESAFALAKSREKQCGICMDIVLDKNDSTKQRFGVLPNCKHCFCLDCIRQWRKAKTFENKIIRACPECRTLSDFVIPSTLWVDEDDEKRALIDAYQSAMKQKTCKYFLKSSSIRGDGDEEECPFGNKCFYKHVRSDGQVVQGDSPRTIRHRMKIRQRRRGSITDIVALWNFVSTRNFGNSSDDNGGAGAGSSSSGRGEGVTAGVESRNRPNRHSSSLGNDSSADWLWDELEYELNLLNVTSGNEDDDGADDFEDFEADYFDDSDWETSAVWE